MTLDEAIEIAKYKVEKAEEEFKFVTLEYQMDKNNDEILAERYGNCKRYLEECKKIAEWLEELKDLRIYRISIDKAVNLAEQSKVNAIDKLVNELNGLSEYARPVGWSKKVEIIPMSTVRDIAEQLKDSK